MGYRVQGILLSSQPDRSRLGGVAKAFGYRLYVVRPRNVWLLDLGVPEPKPTDGGLFRAVRALAPEYVDAVHLLLPADVTAEQLPWLAATAYVAAELNQPVLGFVSDDDTLDFAAVADPSGVTCVADHVESFLMRWDHGALTVQGLLDDDPLAEAPQAPDELRLIPGITIMPTEEVEGYPLHGNVAVEMQAVAPGVAEVLGLYSWDGAAPGSLALVDQARLDYSIWDFAAGVRVDEPRQVV